MSNANILVIIPARGGSKGIPSKNIRPLNGKPLIYYAIQNAKAISHSCDIYVSSDDDEILSIASKFGVGILKRNKGMAMDHITLDPVIIDAFKATGGAHDLVVTLQPTSPLLKADSLNKALQKMLDNTSIDTMLSAIEDVHLKWGIKNGEYYPLFEKRLNRQQLPMAYKETGGFVICRSRVLGEHESRFGTNIQLYPIPKEEAIDIDGYDDWSLCEYYLRGRKILFVVIGNSIQGLGHVYNSLILAQNIMSHSVEFLVVKGNALAYKKISESNFKVTMQENELLNDIVKIKPDIVINDCLDTTVKYIDGLRSNGIKVVNIEDLGDGSKKADLVFNAIYPEKEAHLDSSCSSSHYYGEKYFCARSEFVYSKSKEITPKVDNVLISFGGVDPNNLTKKVLDSIYGYCNNNQIHVKIILGLGYNNNREILEGYDIEILSDVKNISDHILEADIIFTSAGRTIFEVACLGVPSITLCQNELETTHFFATEKNGFVNLGLGTNVSGDQIEENFIRLVANYYKRIKLSNAMLAHDLKGGTRRVISKILELTR